MHFRAYETETIRQNIGAGFVAGYSPVYWAYNCGRSVCLPPQTFNPVDIFRKQPVFDIYDQFQLINHLFIGINTNCRPNYNLLT